MPSAKALSKAAANPRPSSIIDPAPGGHSSRPALPGAPAGGPRSAGQVVILSATDGPERVERYEPVIGADGGGPPPPMPEFGGLPMMPSRTPPPPEPGRSK